jgi:hypothetical protein
LSIWCSGAKSIYSSYGASASESRN